MKPATVKQIKTELENKPQDELIEICLRLSKFNKENKELINYVLFQSYDENEYIENVKLFIKEEFDNLNFSRNSFLKKGVRRILKLVKKHIKYSKNKETEIELLLYFNIMLKNRVIPEVYYSDEIIKNLYYRQEEAIKKKVMKLHEDLQFDYLRQLEGLE